MRTDRLASSCLVAAAIGLGWPGLVSAATAVRAPSLERSRAAEAVGVPLLETKGLSGADLARAKGLASGPTSLPLPDHESDCVVHSISCGQTRTSSLTQHDCELDDGTFVDFWLFDGKNGDTVTVDMSSNAFDSFLFLLDPIPQVVANDDDSGPGLDARIVHQLDVTGEWAIAANNTVFVPGSPGPYTLSLQCDSGGPGGPSGPLAAPTHLTAAPFSPTQIELRWDDNSNNESGFQIDVSESGGPFQSVGTLPANSEIAEVFGLTPDTPYGFRVRAVNTTHQSTFSNTATARTFVGVGAVCLPGATVHCLNDGRFQVQMSFRTRNKPNETGQTGLAQTVPFQTDDSGLFYFFGTQNWEVLFKVLRGCNVNGHYWVFFAATTDVELNVHVADTETGLEVTYFNPLDHPADAITDTSAFETCP
jgi:hypothetical protein